MLVTVTVSGSYLSHLRDFLPVPSSFHFHELTAYVANSVAAGVGAATRATERRPSLPRVVVWKSFEEFEFGGRRYLFLILGLIDGFQVFEVESTKDLRLVAHYSDAPAPTSFDEDSMVRGNEAAAHMLNQRAVAATPIGCVKFITHPITLRSTTHQSESASSSPASTSQQPYWGTLLAVCSADDRNNFPRSMVKIYSLAHNRYVHFLRFRSRVLGLTTHPASRYLIVSLESEIHVYTTPIDGRTLQFDCVWSARTMPNPSPNIMHALQQGAANGSVNLGAHAATVLATSSFSKDEWPVMAVSKRWIAYCPAESVQEAVASVPATVDGSDASSGISCGSGVGSGRGGGSGRNSFVDASSSPPLAGVVSSGESLSNVAHAIGSKLYNLGGLSRKALSSYLAGETGDAAAAGVGAALGVAAAAAASSTSTTSSLLGTVLVRDLESQRLIACIRAHPNTQITHLAFDRSGTLLATVPVDGQYIHVYQVVMIPHPAAAKASAAAAAASETAAQASKTHSPQLSSRRASHSHSPSLHPSLHPSQITTTSAASSLSASIAPSSSPSHVAAAGSTLQPTFHTRFLYRLFRGITHATIRSISFSFDGKYLVLVSSKGTAHIYAIHPILGGDISAATHGPDAERRGVENGLIQQMVGKVDVLCKQKRGHHIAGAGVSGRQSRSSSASSPGDESSSLVGLDSFLYQPKTLSAIYRIKMDQSIPSTPISPMYLPVIASFQRMPHPSASAGTTAGGGHRLNGTDEPPIHHLLLCTATEELCVYALSTAYKPSSESSDGATTSSTTSGASQSGQSVSGGAGLTAPDLQRDSSEGSVDSPEDFRPKLALQVAPISTFELAPTALNNAMTSQVAAQTAALARQRAQQPHQQQRNVDQSMDEPTVRILTQKGQEDEPESGIILNQQQSSTQQQQASPHQPPSNAGGLLPRPSGPLGFFQSLDEDRLFGPATSSPAVASASAHHSPSPSSSSAGPAPITIQRTPLSSISPVFAALTDPPPASGHASLTSSPRMAPVPSATAGVDEEKAARWLSHVELRTYASSDVSVWSSPQFSLECFERGSIAPQGTFQALFVEQRGGKKILGNADTSVQKPAQDASVKQDPKAETTSSMESEINAALSSSMLDDAGFSAALREGSDSSHHGGGTGTGTGGFLDEEGQSSMIFGLDQADVGNIGGGAHSAKLLSAVDEAYYSAPTHTPLTVDGAAVHPEAANHVGAKNDSSMNGITPSPQANSNTVSSPPVSIGAPPSPSAAGQSMLSSTLFNPTSSTLFPSTASASEILTASLPPSSVSASCMVDESEILSPMRQSQAKSISGKKKKKKSKSKIGRVQEISSAAAESEEDNS